MINSTRLRAAISAAFLIVTCLFFVYSVQAQSQRLKVTVPFDFYAGEALLPAGDYELAPWVNSVMRITAPASNASTTFSTISLGGAFGKTVSPKVVFTQYGQDHFLSEVWWGNGNTGRKSMTSKHETELAKTFRPIRFVAASRP